MGKFFLGRICLPAVLAHGSDSRILLKWRAVARRQPALRIPEKFLWPFWIAAIALAVAHLFFQNSGQAQSAHRASLQTRLTLETLETQTSELEKNVVDYQTSNRLDPLLVEEFHQLILEIAEVNDQILHLYIEPENAGVTLRALQSRFHSLETKTAEVLEKNKRSRVPERQSNTQIN